MKLIDYLLTNNDYTRFSYPEDVERIVKVFKNKDIEITPDEANELWDRYSDDLCASWIGLPDNDNKLFDIVIEYAKRKYRVGD